jgi:hypothetical protein
MEADGFGQLAVWNGSSWSAGPAVRRRDYQYFGGSFSNTLAEVWDGTTRSLRSTPNHSYAGQNILNGVSCGASSVCTAVGQTQDIGGTEATLIETGD